MKNVITFFNMIFMQRYIPSEGERSNLVQTSWAMMALIHTGQVQTL